MEDFLWSCKSCKATFPSLDNITKYLKESLDKSDTRMTKLEDRMGKLESSNLSTNKAVLDMKDEICQSLKEDVNKLVDARNSELEDRRRRESNITLFNLREHNFPTGQENKTADAEGFQHLCSCLGIDTPNMVTWFRLGKKAPDKTRPLKIVLESRAQRKTILENAKYIPQKVPFYLNRVIISKDLTPTQRSERKLRCQNNQRNQPRQMNDNKNVSTVRQNQDGDSNGGTSPTAMNMSHGVSPIIEMLHLNLSTHSQSGRALDAYNNTTIAMDDTIMGGSDSQHGLADDSIGQIPSVGDDT